MFKARSLTSIRDLVTVLEISAHTADTSRRALIVRHLYLLAEDLVGRRGTSDLDVKQRIQLLIKELGSSFHEVTLRNPTLKQA